MEKVKDKYQKIFTCDVKPCKGRKVFYRDYKKHNKKYHTKKICIIL